MDTDTEDSGFDLVLKELISLHHEDAKSKDSNRSGFDRVLRELMTQREKAAVAAERLRQQSELMAEREKTAAERLKQQEEVALMLAKQQNDFQLQLQKQQEEFEAKLEKREERLRLEAKEEQKHHQELIEQERREHLLRQDNLLARQDELIACERREALEKQERPHAHFREVIQQLQEEVKTLRHNESAHLIPGTQRDIETPGGYKTPASGSVLYQTTPLSLMETPSKPFEDSIGGKVVENFAAGESGSVAETNNYVENDAVEEEEPTKITKSDQGSVVLSDEDLRAKGLISFEESFLLNKSDQVGNKVENAKGKKLPLQKITTNKSRAQRDAKEKMKVIAGK